MNCCHFEILSNSFKLDSISVGKARKKNLDDMLCLMGKELTSPWRLGLYNYIITRQAVREPSWSKGSFEYLMALLLQGRMGVALD